MPTLPPPDRTLRLGATEIPFRLVRSPNRRRTIGFAIDDAVLTVRAPTRASFKSIEELAQRHAEWILTRLAAARTVRTRSYESGESLQVLGTEVRILVFAAGGRRSTCTYHGTWIEVRVPTLAEPGARRGAVAVALERWYRGFAAAKFAERSEHYAHRLGVRPGRILVSNPRARWGSCDAANNIRLNWRLAMAPQHLLDYVVAHELCHVVHKNHGPRFWRLLETIMPDCRERQRTLQDLGPTLAL